MKTEEKILKYLKKADWPSTTEMVAKALNISWNTAQVYLLKLANKRKVKYKKVGRQNQFWINKKYKEHMGGNQ